MLATTEACAESSSFRVATVAELTSAFCSIFAWSSALSASAVLAIVADSSCIWVSIADRLDASATFVCKSATDALIASDSSLALASSSDELAAVLTAPSNSDTFASNDATLPADDTSSVADLAASSAVSIRFSSASTRDACTRTVHSVCRKRPQPSA